jgi:hypothetical protein
MMLYQALQPHELLKPATDAAGRTGDYISMKNALKAWIVCQVAQGDANVVLFEPKQADTVAGGNVKALTTNVRIWTKYDTPNTSNFTAQTDAVNFTTSAATNAKVVIFEIDPVGLDTANSFDCLTMVTGASNVGNLTAAMVYVQQRWPRGVPPSIIAE